MPQGSLIPRTDITVSQSHVLMHQAQRLLVVFTMVYDGFGRRDGSFLSATPSRTRAFTTLRTHTSLFAPARICILCVCVCVRILSVRLLSGAASRFSLYRVPVHRGLLQTGG